MIFTHIPQGNYRLLVFNNGAQTVDSQVTLAVPALQKLVTLIDGTSVVPSDVHCVLPATHQPTIVQPIKILSLGIAGSAGVQLPQTTSRNVTLTATFDRTPGVYRVGETQDLTSAPWLPFNPNTPIIYRLKERDALGIFFGARTINLQVAPAAAEASVSLPKAIPVILAPAVVKTRTLRGTERASFLQQAANAGYSLNVISLDRKLDGLVTTDSSFNCAGPGLEPRFTVQTNGGSVYSEEQRFRIFSGPPLNSFWRIQSAELRPSATPTNAQVTIDPVSITTEQGLHQVPARTFVLKASVKVKIETPLGVCVVAPQFGFGLSTPVFTSLTIEGPEGLDPVNALPPRN